MSSGREDLKGPLRINGEVTNTIFAQKSDDYTIQYIGPTPKGDADLEFKAKVDPGIWMVFAMWANEDIYSRLCDCKEECDLHPSLVAKKDTAYLNIMRVQ